MSEKLKRTDPINCKCTDCIIGYSKPLDYCDNDDLKKLHKGKLQNAAGVKVTVSYGWEYN